MFQSKRLFIISYLLKFFIYKEETKLAFQVKKAKREKIYVKVALMAPSGGGKTYGSLRLATGMA